MGSCLGQQGRPALGQAKSGRRGAGKDRPGSQAADAQFLMDLNLLPHEPLVLILSWVPGRILVTHCRLVCSKWRELVDGPVVWTTKWERHPSHHQALQATLEAARLCPKMEWARVGLLQPFGRNLVKNPRGEGGCQHWDVDNYGCSLGISYWITQLIDLVKEGLWEDLLDTFQPDIYISGWWGTHEECKRQYNINVDLLARDKKTVMASFVREHNKIRKEDVPFQQTSHVFRKYGPGVRYLRFKHSSRWCWSWERLQPQGWQSEPHSEPHITNATVWVKLTQ